VKVKILIGDRGAWYWNTDNIGKEFEITEYTFDIIYKFKTKDGYYIHRDDVVITELPVSFCVKKCDDKSKWKKYINWLRKKYKIVINDYPRFPYYGNELGHSIGKYISFGTEIHIDDVIKHIDFYGETISVESEEEFDMSTNEGRLAYAKHNYSIGTKYLPIDSNGKLYDNNATSIYEPRLWFEGDGEDIEVGKGLIYYHSTNKWAAIIDEVEKFDMTTNEGRLAYAKKHYPIGTKYKSLYSGQELIVGSYDGHLCLQPEGTWSVYDFLTNKWAEIVEDEQQEEEKVMETQKLSRQGLKEIHSVACGGWKEILEKYGTTNPLEDYIELTQAQVDTMFNSCTTEQLPIVSKYLKQDDGSVDVSHCIGTSEAIHDMFGVRMYGEYNKKAFSLNTHKYDWQLGLDSEGVLCLIPTKKK
jgi:hypothetical protein